MDTAVRINDALALHDAIERHPEYRHVILGHESCPVFYQDTPIDEMIRLARQAGLGVKINIPVVFEDYLDYFKAEAARLLAEYPYAKLILNDWGMISYMHALFPQVKFAVGLGLSFSYADCPWNYHIVSEELEKYQEMLQTHNCESDKTVSILKEQGVDEIVISDLKVLEKTCRKLKELGMSVTINRNVNIVTISRACHILRILGKNAEMGKGCSRYCRERTILRGTHYYDMALTIYDRVSEETRSIQPEMYFYSNILFSRNTEAIANERHEYCDMLIDDYRY